MSVDGGLRSTVFTEVAMAVIYDRTGKPITVSESMATTLLASGLGYTSSGGSTSTNNVASAPTAVTVGTSSVQLLASRSSRRAFLIQNVSESATLYLGFGAAPTTSNGVKVPAGTSFSDQGFTGDVYGIASASGTSVRVVEFD